MLRYIFIILAFIFTSYSYAYDDYIGDLEVLDTPSDIVIRESTESAYIPTSENFYDTPNNTGTSIDTATAIDTSTVVVNNSVTSNQESSFFDNNDIDIIVNFLAAFDEKSIQARWMYKNVGIRVGAVSGYENKSLIQDITVSSTAGTQLFLDLKITSWLNFSIGGTNQTRDYSWVIDNETYSASSNRTVLTGFNFRVPVAKGFFINLDAMGFISPLSGATEREVSQDFIDIPQEIVDQCNAINNGIGSLPPGTSIPVCPSGSAQVIGKGDVGFKAFVPGYYLSMGIGYRF